MYTLHITRRGSPTTRTNYPTPDAAMAAYDSQELDGDAVVREGYTSDGTHWVVAGHAYGRVIATRDATTNEKWLRE